MSYPKAFRLPGQHRRQVGDVAARCVAALWMREHPHADTGPIENLGIRHYVARHALSPKRRRVYMPVEAA